MSGQRAGIWTLVVLAAAGVLAACTPPTTTPGGPRPTVTAALSTGRTATSSTSIVLAVSASAGSTEARWWNQGEAPGGWQPLATVVPWTLPGGPDGERLVQGQVRDADGRTSATAELRIRLDRVAPSIVVAAPAELATVQLREGPFSLSGDATDDQQVRTVTVKQGADARLADVVVGPSVAWSFPVAAPASGRWSYEVVAEDEAGNTATATRTVDVVVPEPDDVVVRSNVVTLDTRAADVTAYDTASGRIELVGGRVVAGQIVTLQADLTPIAPQGFLRRVTSASSAGGVAVLDTERAALADVFAQGDLSDVPGSAARGAPAAPSARGAADACEGFTADSTVAIDLPLPTMTIAADNEEEEPDNALIFTGVRFAGFLTATKLKFGMHWGVFDTHPTWDIRFDIGALLCGTATIKVSDPEAADLVDLRRELWSRDLPKFTIPAPIIGGIPISPEVELDAVVNVQPDVTGAASVGFHAGGTAWVGTSDEDASQGDVDGLGDLQAFLGGPNDPALSEGFGAEARLDLNVDFEAWDVGGISVGVEPYVNATAALQVPDGVKLEICLGIRLTVGGEVDVWSVDWEPTLAFPVAEWCKEAFPPDDSTPTAEWTATDGLPDGECPPWQRLGVGGVLDGAVMRFSSGSNGAVNGYLRDAVLEVGESLTVGAELRVLSSSSSAPSRTAANISFATAAGVGNALMIGAGEIFLLSGNLQRGQSASLDTSVFHDYEIQVDAASGGIAVRVDGDVVLTGSTFSDTAFNGSSARILWGDGSLLASGVSEWRSVRHDSLAGGQICP